MCFTPVQGGVLPTIMIPDNNDEVNASIEGDESEESEAQEQSEAQEEEAAVTGPSNAGRSSCGSVPSSELLLERLAEYIQGLGGSLGAGWSAKAIPYARKANARAVSYDVYYKSPTTVRGPGGRG